MVKFRQKIFAEYDAMRSLYVELMKDPNNKYNINTIDTSALIPILKGNNIVIERFVINTSVFGKDKYRMYLKIGSKVKMPERVKLPGRYFDKKVGNLSFNINNGLFAPGRKIEGKKPNPNISSNYSPSIDLSYKNLESLGETLKYDEKERSLVLEFKDIRNAIESLKVLPFGLGYKIYLLN